jgi:hypothetical protein
MLPFLGFVRIKIRCPHCQRDEGRWRATTIVGLRHTCPFCGRRYRIREMLSPTTSRPV